MSVELRARRSLGQVLDRLRRRREENRPDGWCRYPPRWLVLGVNNLCNLHCKMCDVGLNDRDTVFYRNLIGNDPRNMSLELLQKILDQADSFRPRPRIGLAFAEPLLHPRIVDFCRAISKRGLYSSITTNGYRLPQLAEDLVNGGCDHITVSIDGSEEVHDRVRRRKGSFARARRGVELLNRARVRAGVDHPQVQFSYTITDESATDMLRFVREIEGLKPTSLVFSHLNFITTEMAQHHNSLHNGSLRVTRSNLGSIDPGRIASDALWASLEELKSYLRSRGSSWTLVPDFTDREELEIYYREPATFIGDRVCTDPWQMMMVQTDGDVIPAHGRCYHVPLGRVTETPLVDIWNGAPSRAFRRRLASSGGTLPACSRCCGVIGKTKKGSRSS